MHKTHEWIRDIPYPTWDVDSADLATHLEAMGFEDVEVLDWTEPVRQDDSYLIHDVEIRYTWGMTEEMRAAHGHPIPHWSAPR